MAIDGIERGTLESHTSTEENVLIRTRTGKRQSGKRRRGRDGDSSSDEFQDSAVQRTAPHTYGASPIPSRLSISFVAWESIETR